MMTQNEKHEAGEFIKDFWKFMQKHLEFKDDDEYWDDLIQGADVLAKKYKYDPVYLQTVTGFVAGLDEKWRKQTGRWRE